MKLIHQQRIVLFVDESIYSKQLGNVNIWQSQSSQEQEYALQKYNFPAQAVVAATDMYGYIRAKMIFPKSLDQHDFIEFLRSLRHQINNRKILYILLDNLRVHRTFAVTSFCQRNRIRLLYNSAYSSEFMPIERLWWLSKKLVREYMLLSPSLRMTENQIRQMIDKSMDNYDRGQLERYTASCIRKIQEAVN